MNRELKNCAFQYYNGVDIIVDKTGLQLSEAKDLFNEHYIDMYNRTKDGLDIECAIWVDMKTSSDYRETFLHISSPDYDDTGLYEKRRFENI